ncbi:general substrate transporter [Xylona heveae TC161]|uniref:General substrate transporter n=1 Tax=Xylona heveae (strain CBS 132557 / TC161) TaxID=1328760 RepID=A0A165IZ72_XYLHT|nr:general substrate transporter [Xylona heveae TC161]KZF25576.1 general substrate transporter [Xylona heveae TC161]
MQQGEDVSHVPLIRDPSTGLEHTSPEIHSRDEPQALHQSQIHRPGRFLWTLTCTAGISGLLFGYDTGVISSALVSIQSGLSGRVLTTADKSIITSCTSLLALLVSPLAGILADRLGRKKLILVADALFILGALWQACTASVWGMVAGRGIVGLAIGAASMVVPLYISELAPSSYRGRLVTIFTLFITGGQVVAYLVGYVCSSHLSGWRWSLGLGALPAVLQALMLGFLPDTPRWLVKAGKIDAAKRVLEQVYGSGPGMRQVALTVLRAIDEEILEEDAHRTRHGHGRGPAKRTSCLGLARVHDQAGELCGVASNRRALTIACLLQGLQQLCGFNSLMYFSATIFSIVGFRSPTLTSLSIAITNFIFTLLAFALIDRIGRRRILLYSIPVMILGLAISSAAFHFVHLKSMPRVSGSGSSGSSSSSSGIDTPSVSPSDTPTPHDNNFAILTILVAMIIYVCGYASGIGNVPWQQSELFPLSVRSLGSSLATATNWGSNFVIGLTFLPMMDYLSPTLTFALYAVICVVGWVLVWLIYPETSGLSLEEVGDLLQRGWGVHAHAHVRRSGGDQGGVGVLHRRSLSGSAASASASSLQLHDERRSGEVDEHSA